MKNDVLNFLVEAHPASRTSRFSSSPTDECFFRKNGSQPLVFENDKSVGKIVGIGKRFLLPFGVPVGKPNGEIVGKVFFLQFFVYEGIFLSICQKTHLGMPFCNAEHHIQKFFRWTISAIEPSEQRNSREIQQNIQLFFECFRIFVPNSPVTPIGSLTGWALLMPFAAITALATRNVFCAAALRKRKRETRNSCFSISVIYGNQIRRIGIIVNLLCGGSSFVKVSLTHGSYKSPLIKYFLKRVAKGEVLSLAPAALEHFITKRLTNQSSYDIIETLIGGHKEELKPMNVVGENLFSF